MNKYATFLWVIAGLGIVASHRHAEASTPWLVEVDYRQLVSQADLIYERPAATPVQGQPIGNGRMGTMIWTSPGAIHMQINHVDVFAVNKNHAGKRGGPADYCGGTAKITIELGGQPLLAGETFRQCLSLYGAECAIGGKDVNVRCFVSAVEDVLAIEVDDRRATPQPLRVKVSMLRKPEVRTGGHVARSAFVDGANRVSLVQRFQEKEHYNASAVAVAIVENGVEVAAPSEQERAVVAPAARGKRTVLISSAAAWQPGLDVGAAASCVLTKAMQRPLEDLRREHGAWWSDFWSRTFIDLTRGDGVAEFMERLRTLQLYYMASSSRGRLPAKYNGSIFAVDGDRRAWGAQFWVWTTEVSHYPLYAADASELTDPFFNMYVNQLPAAKEAAMQRWGVEGAYFLEAGPFDGPVVLPEKIAQEYQDVYLGRKTIHDLSPAAVALGQYEAVLTQFADGNSVRGEAGRYSYVSHMASSGSELAAQAWWRYRYTGDRQWLRTHAYPLLRETVEFYRGLAEKGSDGRYHIWGTNQHEVFWGVNDGQVDLAAIRGTVPLAMRAAAILDLDLNLRTKWQEFLENLTPYTMGSDPESQSLEAGVLAEDVWSVGHLGEVQGQRHLIGTVLEWPVFPFEDWTLETRHPEIDRIVHKIAELNPTRIAIREGGQFNTTVRSPISGVRMGRGEELPLIMASYYQQGFAPLPNGFSNFEGPTAHSIEHLGILGTVLQESLLQSVSARPGEPEVIRVFPAWPRQWQASFRLLARGGFLVSASLHNGEVSFVELQSRRGETCRLRNPWGEACVVTQVDGPSQILEGELLQFDTVAGQRYRVFPQGAPPPAARLVQAQPTGRPWSYATTLPGGKQVSATVGIPGAK